MELKVINDELYIMYGNKKKKIVSATKELLKELNVEEILIKNKKKS